MTYEPLAYSKQQKLKSPTTLSLNITKNKCVNILKF